MNAHAPVVQSHTDLVIETTTDGRRLWLQDRAQWDALLTRSDANSIFMTSAWLGAWADTLGEKARLIGVTARNGDHLIGAAVFEEADGVLSLAGRGASDYTDLVIDNYLSDRAYAALLAQILTVAQESVVDFRHFQLNRLKNDSRTATSLTSGATPGYFATQTASVGAPQMDMAVVDERLGKKRFKRRENRLNRAGEVACTTFANAPEVAERLDEFIDLHIKRWAETDTPSKFSAGSNRNFYAALTQRLGQAGVLRYTELRLDDKLAGAHYGFFYNGTFTFYKPAYDPDLSRVTPGDVVLKRLLEFARDEAATLFDFTIGEEPYKLGFATSVPQVVSLHVTDSRVGAMVRQARAGARRLLFNVIERTTRKAD